MASKVNGTTEYFTPCGSKTRENIDTEIGVNDYNFDLPLYITHFISLDRQAVDWLSMSVGLTSQFKSSYVVTHIFRSDQEHISCRYSTAG